jgi:hypothetical protein
MTERQAENPEPQTEKKQLPVEVFREMERRDESQILAELTGELVQDFVYSIRVGDREVTNLSYSGIKEAIRRRGHVEILDTHIEQDEREYRAIVRVRDLDNAIDVLGASTCERGKPFAWTLALNKSERNAFAKLIPQKWMAETIAEWLKRNKPQNQGTTIKPESLVPPRPSPDKSQAQNGTIPSAGRTVPNHVNTWRIPTTKDQLTPELTKQGIKQYPLLEGTLSFGMVNACEQFNEVSIVPERPVKQEPALVQGFLIRRVIEPLAEKHKLTYELRTGPSGLLEAILIRGHLEEKQIVELVQAARWSFKRALADPEKQPATLPLDRSHVGSPLR